MSTSNPPQDPQEFSCQPPELMAPPAMLHAAVPLSEKDVDSGELDRMLTVLGQQPGLRELDDARLKLCLAVGLGYPSWADMLDRRSHLPLASSNELPRSESNHFDAGLSRIETLMGVDIIGLDGDLEFEVSGAIFHGPQSARDTFESKARAALEAHYGISSKTVCPREFWELHPIQGNC